MFSTAQKLQAKDAEIEKLKGELSMYQLKMTLKETENKRLKEELMNCQERLAVVKQALSQQDQSPRNQVAATHTTGMI